MIAVLSTEEQAAGLRQPSGIGQRPRPISSEELSVSCSWKNSNSRRSSDADFSDDLPKLDRYSICFIATLEYSLMAHSHQSLC